MRVISKLIKGILVFFGVVGLFVLTIISSLLDWYKDTFGVSFEEIIYTIKSPLKGADISFFREAVLRCIPAMIVFFAIIAIFIYVHRILRLTSCAIVFGNRSKIYINTILIVIFFLICTIGSGRVYKNIDSTLNIRQFVQMRKTETHIYEDYYIKPDIDKITADSPKNLIYIYLESMEITYASTDVGGYQQGVNYIPHLTDMAAQNISFSNNDKLGGFLNTSGTGWTIVAIFATQTGLPFSFPIDGNEDFGNREEFAKGVISLGDILEQKGYYQEFLCGSDADFGGRKTFFVQHGNYEIYDIFSAFNDGYLSEDEQSPWGVPDKDLYRIAKDELTRMAGLGQPFNLTMLTVDTHHVDGWMCDLCENKYPEQLANVVECADNQIYDFIDWCSQQEWFDDTVIVIQGDHPRMDTSLVEGVDYGNRRIYNCFINARYNSDPELNYREFTPEDMFPTILSSMGFTVPDGRLGLGTDMFSSRKTLAEELGLTYFNQETGKYSSYYIDEFS